MLVSHDRRSPYLKLKHPRSTRERESRETEKREGMVWKMRHSKEDKGISMYEDYFFSGENCDL